MKNKDNWSDPILDVKCSICGIRKSRIQTLDDKKVIKSVNLPVSCATCACLGGPDMNWLFITTGSFVGENHSGGLFVTKVETKGVAESRFTDNI